MSGRGGSPQRVLLERAESGLAALLHELPHCASLFALNHLVKVDERALQLSCQLGAERSLSTAHKSY
jgi:hypothetical protein